MSHCCAIQDCVQIGIDAARQNVCQTERLLERAHFATAEAKLIKKAARYRAREIIHAAEQHAVEIEIDARARADQFEHTAAEQVRQDQHRATTEIEYTKHLALENQRKINASMVAAIDQKYLVAAGQVRQQTITQMLHATSMCADVISIVSAYIGPTNVISKTADRYCRECNIPIVEEPTEVSHYSNTYNRYKPFHSNGIALHPGRRHLHYMCLPCLFKWGPRRYAHYPCMYCKATSRKTVYMERLWTKLFQN